jgi:hypothetical protein
LLGYVETELQEILSCFPFSWLKDLEKEKKTHKKNFIINNVEAIFLLI